MVSNERIGERFVSNEGYGFVIVEYNNNKDVLVEFQDEHKTRVHTTYSACQQGNIKNPYNPSVYNHGYLGLMSDGTRPKVKVNGKDTREYKVWHSMIQRVYDPKYHEKHPTYKDCILEDCLHCYAYFLEFVIRDIPNYEYWLTHPNERVSLDKDIRGNGNKIYSRDTIMFVSGSENAKEVVERCGNSFGSQPTKVYGINIKTGEKTKVFNSLKEVEREIGVGASNIGKCLNNKCGYKTAGGYKWFRVE